MIQFNLSKKNILKYFLNLFLCLLLHPLFSQTKTPADFGFRHFVFKYKSDQVDILIKSKKGEDAKPKPLFFFCQGSQPKPLIIYDERGTFGVFPFKTDSLIEKYHLVIVSKPYVPLIANAKTLERDFNYHDSLGKPPKEYSQRNLLSYYSDRNIEVLKYLQQQNWVSTKQLVVAGHSEGATIAARMAFLYPKITHLIYSGGNPFGRIMSIIQQSRAIEDDSTKYGEEELKYWKSVVENKTSLDDSHGDTDKATFEFSTPCIDDLEQLNIPVLVSYGTKDHCAPFNDYLQVDVIRKGKQNFTFNAYVGLEHNFFPLDENNKANQKIFNWDKVATDWLKWLNGK